MTFEELKLEIMNRARSKNICDEFQNILMANSYIEILEAGKKFPNWVWGSGIMDLELLQEFPENDLIQSNIYINSAQIINPTSTVYALDNANIEMSLHGDNRNKVICMGGSTHIICHNNSYLSINSYFNANVKITLHANSICNGTFYNQSRLNQFQSFNNTSAEITLKSRSNANLIESNGNSFVNLKMVDYSTSTIQQNEDSTIQTKTSTNTVINYGNQSQK